MALWPGPDKSVFWFDFEGLTDGNLFKDLGPYGLHAAPQAGFASPNFGLARNAHGKGYALMTGAANRYATIPTRFYNYAPLREHTWVAVVGSMTINPAGFSRIFSCESLGANYYGLAFGPNMAADPGFLLAAQCKGPVSFDRSQTPASSLALPRDSVVVQSNATGPQGMIQRVGVTTTWTAGAFGTAAYNTAVVPCIGQLASGGSFFLGRLYFLALLPFQLTDSEAKALTDWLMVQV
jgi:hypothetical protein